MLPDMSKKINREDSSLDDLVYLLMIKSIRTQINNVYLNFKNEATTHQSCVIFHSNLFFFFFR